MYKHLTTLGLVYATSSLSASAAITLIAGWDTFDNGSSSAASITNLGTTATLSGTATGGSWGQWNGTGDNNAGASPDGTFGNLDPLVATASLFGPGEGSNSGSNLSLNRSVKPGSLIFSLVNNSGADQPLAGFYFDGAHRFSQSAPDWTLTFSDAISGTAASGTLVNQAMDDAGASRDWAIDLTSLTDNVWEAGSTATFTLTFDGGPAAASGGGGHETLVDNIGITADVIPEPSMVALLSLAGFGLILRRRS